MSYLSMVEARLPPGFRFHPRDDELIGDYLIPKVNSAGDANAGACAFPTMIDIDLNKCEPWDLPDTACVGAKEWYFFNLRDRKYATGQRTNRATMSGYWKATGKDRQVVRKGTLVGMRKTLVFYQGRAPKGKKTDWVMHEFRLEGRNSDPPPLPRYSCKEDWVLCRVFYKSRGIGNASKHLARAESCYDDTGSSTLPPLTDAYIAFDQTFPQLPPPPPPPSISAMAGNFISTAATALEQVPCFSNYPQITTTTTQQQYIPLIERSLPSCDKKVLRSVLDHLTKFDGQQQKNKRDEAPSSMQPQASSESYLTETALSSTMWYPFHN